MDDAHQGSSWTEAERLAALKRYGVLDTPAERDFDDLVRMASGLLGTPIAAINLIDADRQWFKAEVGLDVREMPLDSVICARLLLSQDELVIPDLLEDPRFACNPLVATDLGLRFYAGELLRTPEGLPLGTLCVLDTAPRPQGLTEGQRFALQTLSRQVMSQLELRRAAAERDRAHEAQRSTAARDRQIVDSPTDFAIVATDLQGQVTRWNTGAENVLGWTEREMLGQTAERFFTPEDRAAGRIEVEMRGALRDGRANDERWHLRKDGTRFWASGAMTPLRDEAGQPVGFVKVLRDRTEQHEAGAALDALSERHRLAQRATSDAIWDWDQRSNAVSWNEALQAAYGWRPEQVEPTGDWWIAQIHPEDRGWVDGAIHAVLDGTGEHWAGEYRFRRADGSYAEVLDRGYVIRDGQGRPVRMIGAMLDLTQVRTAETALRASEERFRTILETVEAAFAIVQVKFDSDDRPVDYRFLEANDAFARQAGVDLRGKWVTEYAPELEQFWFDTYGHVAKTREPMSFESYAKAFARWFDVRAVPVGDPADRQIAIIFGDVTERHAAEERLRASEALAQENIQRVQLALAAGAIIGTWNWDLPADRLTVDEAFTRTFGLDPALGQIGLSFEQMVATVHPDDKAGLVTATNEAIARGGPYVHQYRVRRADGRYCWIEANGRVEHAPDGTPLNFPGVVLDVEERRAVEAERDRVAAELRALTETLEQRVAERTAELLHAEEQLRQAQKMEAVGQLTGGIAHDFNNLLTGITGSLELLGTRIAQGRLRELERYVAAADGAAKRAAALTHRLLAFSRQQTLDPRPTHVNRLVTGMVELVRRTIGPAITLEVVGAAGVWSTLVDPHQLENALLNLAINARDAMPEGGRLTVETANAWLDTRVAKERDMAPGQYVTVSVTDTGTGMPPEVIARAFDPFFTTKPLGQGTGLGLSMIYGFAKQTGGQVRIYSELGQGTTVRLYLPRHVGEVEAAEEMPSLAQAPRALVGQTVLVVDDEPTIRMLVTEVLEDLGYAAVEASDGASGLGILRSDARIDLLVTDVGLPNGMNGRQLADAARLTRPELRVLFITGYAENAVVGNGHLAPGMHVMTKPFALEALASRIKELIGGSST
ncbi:PAS domain-containing protein [Roseomonas sp. 18066]|uniref:PAS domain-containing protein n=1 Tax=Roseomonas sp. 18066 TaxID=2681412 RepID=UPI001357E53E|nr:PAS domain-containing protein [Roseomonas sp. 18066]